MKKSLFVPVIVLCVSLIGACNANQPINNSSYEVFNDDENTQLLAYYPLDDGTYTVGVGNATLLSSIRIPDTYLGKTVSSISENGFKTCTNLTSITLPYKLTSIGSSAFKGCSSLTSIKIPDSTKEISDSAFENCSNLSSIEFGKSLSKIGALAFAGCDDNPSMNYSDTIENWKKISLGENWLNLSSLSIVHCVDGNYSLWEKEVLNFSFNVSLANGSNSINIGEKTSILIEEIEGSEIVEREYTYTTSNSSVATCTDGEIIGKASGKATIKVKEVNSNLEQSISLDVTNYLGANGYYDFSTANTETKAAIVGKLEEYAMDHNFTGLPVFENGTYMKFSNRVRLATSQYIPNYGFGLIEEGELTDYNGYINLPACYFDSIEFSRRRLITEGTNELGAYVTSAYWEKRMNEEKDGFEMYPVLAQDNIRVDGKSIKNDRPIPVVNGYEVRLNVENVDTFKSNTWRIYVTTDSIKYRYAGQPWDGAPNFDGMQVKLEDYAFIYRLLLEGYFEVPDFISDIVGANDYINNIKVKDDAYNTNLWTSMRENGTLGIKTGIDTVNGDYIQLTFNNAINVETMMNRVSKKHISPIPEEFIAAIGGGSLYDGARYFGGNASSSNIPFNHRDAKVDFMISVGPYFLESYDRRNTYPVLKKNDMWNEPNRYKIKGINIIPDTRIYELYIGNLFDKINSGEIDACEIPYQHLKTDINTGNVYQINNRNFRFYVNSTTEQRWNELRRRRFGETSYAGEWVIKPWMSNNSFLKGIFYSIDREAFALSVEAKPTINFFSSESMIDLENNVPYNSTQAHKNAISKYETNDKNGKNTYGYSKEIAVAYFKNAVKEMIKSNNISYGSVEKPREIMLAIKGANYFGQRIYEKIVDSIQEAFNDPRVSKRRIILNVYLGDSNIFDVEGIYSSSCFGTFDICSCMEKYMSSRCHASRTPIDILRRFKGNSDYFDYETFTWCEDTSEISETQPLIYDGKIWSYDALCEALYAGATINNGLISQ